MKKKFIVVIATLLLASFAITSCSDAPIEDSNGSGEACQHDYTETTVIAEATCNTVGIKKSICSLCGDTVTNTVPMTAHTEVIDAAVVSTCEKTGLTEGKHCSVCNTVIIAQTSTPACGHTEVIDKAVAPTCTEAGLEEGNSDRPRLKMLGVQSRQQEAERKKVWKR